jgi:hypothetical protein
MSDLRLDDHAMYLLWQIDDAEDDLAHAPNPLDRWQSSRQAWGIALTPSSLDAPVLEWGQRVDRARALWPELFAHIQRLNGHRDIAPKRTFATHLTLNARIVQQVDLLLFLKGLLESRRAVMVDETVTGVTSTYRSLEERLKTLLLRAYRQTSKRSMG